MIYGYCRVSTKHQRITRQVTNITAVYPNAIIIREFYTGTVQQRPLWDKLVGQIIEQVKFNPPLTPPYMPFGIRRFNSKLNMRYLLVVIEKTD